MFLESWGTEKSYSIVKNEMSLAVHWLGPQASTAGGMGSIPGQGAKIP